MEIRVKKRVNHGLRNPVSYNLCWLNAVIQLLEVSDVPLFMSGTDTLNEENAVITILCRPSITDAGFPEDLLFQTQREHLDLHRELEERDTAADASLMMVCQECVLA